MSIYKVILRDGDNPDTSALHVIEKFCYANTRNEASAIFDAVDGPKYHVAGPLKVEESAVPAGATFINSRPA
jgi:hypothetical protein